MANFDSNIYQADQAVRAPNCAGDVVSVIGYVTTTTALAADDVLRLFRKPRGTKVIAWNLWVTDIDSATGTTAKIGTTANDDQYLATVAFGQSAARFSDTNSPVEMWSTDAITAEEDVKITIVADGTSVAGTVYFNFLLSSVQTVLDGTPSANPLPTQLT